MYKQKQGRSEFPKTGRGITSKLAGPGDPPKINVPSEKNIRYTGKGNKYQYVNKLRDSLQSVGKPIGNLDKRMTNVQRELYSMDGKSGKKAFEATSNMQQKYRFHNASNMTGFSNHKNRRLVDAASERLLMSLESQIKKNKKK